MPEVTISVMGIVIAVIVNMVIGGAWFGIFSKQWAKAAGLKPDAMKNAGSGYAKSTIIAIVMAYVLSHMVDYAQANTLMEGMQTGFWLWLGFVATTTASETIWQNKSWDLWLLNNGNYLLSLMAMGAVLALY